LKYSTGSSLRGIHVESKAKLRPDAEKLRPMT